MCWWQTTQKNGHSGQGLGGGQGGIGPSILHLVRTYSNLRVLDLGPKGDYRAQDPIKGDVAPNKEEQATCHNYLEALPT
jgi:hypothetical protein